MPAKSGVSANCIFNKNRKAGGQWRPGENKKNRKGSCWGTQPIPVDDAFLKIGIEAYFIRILILVHHSCFLVFSNPFFKEVGFSL